MPSSSTLSTLAKVVTLSTGVAALYAVYRRTTQPSIFVTQLWTFPIKSCAGYPSASLTLTAEGAEYDREWGIFDANTGNILTQRTHPTMKLLRVSIDEQAGTLCIGAGGKGSVSVPLAHDDTLPVEHLTPANIRNLDGADIRRQGGQVDQFLSEFLEVPVYLGRLVSKRLPRKAALDASIVTDETIALQDFATLTVISEEGMHYVRQGMGDDGINSNHFRPNIVVGCTKYPDEDSWGKFTIGNVTIRTARWCSRCVMPNVDDDGAFSKTRKISEFLRANRMARFPHRDEKADVKPMFGLSVFHTMRGSTSPTVVHLGDPINVLERTAVPTFI